MDALLNFIWLAFFYAVLATPVVLWLDLRVDVLLLMMVIGSCYFFIIRRAIKPVAPMFLAHIIVPVAAWFLAPGMFYMILYIAAAVVLGFFSVYQRYKKFQTISSEFLFFAPGALVALALIVGYLGHTHLYPHYGALIIIVAVGGRLHSRMSTMNTSLRAITLSSNQPLEKILRFDYKAMIILTLLLVGLVLLINVLFIRPILEVISGISINFTLEPTEPGEAMIPQDIFDGGVGGINPLQYLANTYREPNRFFVIFWQIMMWAISIVAVAAICILVFFIILTIYRRMRFKKSGDEDLNEGFEDIKEFIPTPKARSWWRRGPRGEHRVRRLFRETVTRHMKKGVPIKCSDTPLQMADRITKEDIGGLAEEYAGVRYGEISH